MVYAAAAHCDSGNGAMLAAPKSRAKCTPNPELTSGACRLGGGAAGREHGGARGEVHADARPQGQLQGWPPAEWPRQDPQPDGTALGRDHEVAHDQPAGCNFHLKTISITRNHRLR